MKGYVQIGEMKIKTMVVDKDCWIVNLKPFGPNDTDEDIKSFQEGCIKNNIFGIGWIDDKKAPKDEQIHYLAKKDFKWVSKDGKNAKDIIKNVQEGDLALTRLRDGHIYIGKVSKPAFYQRGIDEKGRCSCMCEVEKWYKIENQDELPQAICGRLSQQHQSTINRISHCELKMLVYYVYEHLTEDGNISEQCIEKNQIIDVPKVKLTKSNFARALNYMELEDLVCAYIYKKHREDGYILLPSSCKVSRPKYEFDFVSPFPEKGPITCQVKNQNKDTIYVSDYKTDKNYAKIYLFSGNGNINGSSEENIEIIDKDELYNELVNPNNNHIKYLKDKLEKHYCINNEDGDKTLDIIEKIIEWLGNNGGKIEKGFRGKKRYYVWPEDENIKKTWVAVKGGYFSENYNSFIIDEREKFKKSMDAFGIEWEG